MRRGNLFWGFVLVLLGAVLLLDNLGVFGDLDIWAIFWPALLILMGFWMLLGVFFRRSPATENAVVSLEGAGRASLQFNHGAGRLELAGGALGGNLLEGAFSGGMDLHTSHQGDLLNVTLRPMDQVFPWGNWRDGFHWRCTLNREIPLTLEMNTGAGEAEIDLRDLQVSDFRLKTGASSSRVTLPANAGFTHVRLEAGAASITLSVPDGVAARIRSRTGIASVNVNQARFPRQGEYYQSPDYDSAANKVEINLEAGVGSFEIL